ncbi:unnamed protein product, partial [Laminaria digitata]
FPPCCCCCVSCVRDSSTAVQSSKCIFAVDFCRVPYGQQASHFFDATCCRAFVSLGAWSSLACDGVCLCVCSQQRRATNRCCLVCVCCLLGCSSCRRDVKAIVLCFHVKFTRYINSRVGAKPSRRPLL